MQFAFTEINSKIKKYMTRYFKYNPRALNTKKKVRNIPLFIDKKFEQKS